MTDAGVPDRVPVGAMAAAIDDRALLQLPRVTPPVPLHANSEINWSKLHRAVPILKDDRCARCGELTGDDRWHFLIEVEARSDEPEMIEAAKAYELWLHRKRAEVTGRAVDEVVRQMFGIENWSAR